jgi:hypothetical protein
LDKTVTNRRFDVAPFIFDNIRALIRRPRISHIRSGHPIMCRAGLIEIRTAPVHDRHREVRATQSGLRNLVEASPTRTDGHLMRAVNVRHHPWISVSLG